MIDWRELNEKAVIIAVMRDNGSMYFFGVHCQRLG